MGNQYPQKFNRREFLQFMGLGSISGILDRFNGTSVNAAQQNIMQPPKNAEIELIIHIDTRITEIQVKKHGKPELSGGRATAGIELNNALIEHIQASHRLLIGRLTAEQAILQIGSALPLETTLVMTVRGRDLDNGMPKAVELTSSEVQEAIAKVIDDIISYIELNLKNFVPEGFSLSDIDMIPLEGNFGRIKRLDERMQQATGKTIIVR